MLKNLRLNLSQRDYRQGSTIDGLVTFDTTSPRRISDFTLTMDITAALHLAIPTRSGLRAHTDKTIFAHSKAIKIDHEQARQSRFMIPFSLQIPQACPISAAYLAMATLAHKLTARVTDLCLGHDPNMSNDCDINILPVVNRIGSEAQILKHGKLTCSANKDLLSDSKFFIQVEHPERVILGSHHVKLNTQLQITDGSNQFSKRSERILTDVEVLNRTQVDGSKLCVFIITVPRQLESSVQVTGLNRIHTLTLDAKTNGRGNVTFEIPVKVSSVSSENPQAPTVPRSAMVSMVEDPFSLDVPFALQPRAAPKPRMQQQNRASHHRSCSVVPLSDQVSKIETPFKNLSMDQLALQALSSSPERVLLSSFRDSSARPSSVSSKSSSTDSMSFSTSGSPKSIASSVSSMQMTPEAPCREKVMNASPSKRHTRQRSSLSMLTKRTSALFSFSSKRKQTPDDLEISCCGASAAAALAKSMEKQSPKQVFGGETFSFPDISEEQQESIRRPSTPNSQSSRESAATPETPGSCYSSMPSSPKLEDREYFPTAPPSPSHASLLARRLSFKRAPTRDVPIYNKKLMTPMQDKRVSISETYLSGFDFEGLSSLDSSDAEDLAEEEAGHKRSSAFGLAL